MELENPEQNKTETPVMKSSTFFQEDNGNQSTRLMCIISLIASILFGILTIYTKSQDGIIITFGFLLGCFAPKVLQKFVEQKVDIQKK